MKKLLVFLVTFFVILTLPFTTISCSINQKNNTKYLINWFDNTHPNYKVKSVVLNLKVNKLYMFSGFYIDKVIYQSSNYLSTEEYNHNDLSTEEYNHNDLSASKYSYDYVIYSYQNHKFYDYNNIEDNIYGLIAWLYSYDNNILNSILNYDKDNYDIKLAIVTSINNEETQSTDFSIEISYGSKLSKSIKKHYYAKWIPNSAIPTFKLDKINNSNDN